MAPAPSTGSADLDATPEGDAVLDLGRRRLRLGIIPGGVLVLGAVDDDAVIMRRALPWAFAGRGARPQHRRIDRACREVVIAFDDHRVVARRDHPIMPTRLDHSTLL